MTRRARRGAGVVHLLSLSPPPWRRRTARAQAERAGRPRGGHGPVARPEDVPALRELLDRYAEMREELFRRGLLRSERHYAAHCAQLRARDAVERLERQS